MHLARRQITRIVVLAVGLMVGGAPTPSHAQRPSSLVGLWATEGYGLILDIGTDTLAVLEVTKVSCIPTLPARATTAPAGALGAFTLLDAPANFVILPGTAAAEARVRIAFTASDMIIRRIDKKPATCDTPTPDTPLSNFEVFAQTWAEHYPFFAAKNVDWPAIVAATRSRVSDTTTPEALFPILAGMIAPLQDAHSGLAARSMGRTFRGRSADARLPGSRGAQRGVRSRVGASGGPSSTFL